MRSFQIKKKNGKFYPQHRFLWFLWLDIYHRGAYDRCGFGTYGEAQRALSDYILKLDTSDRTK